MTEALAAGGLQSAFALSALRGLVELEVKLAALNCTPTTASAGIATSRAQARRRIVPTRSATLAGRDGLAPAQLGAGLAPEACEHRKRHEQRRQPECEHPH